MDKIDIDIEIDWNWRRWSLGTCLLLGHESEKRNVLKRVHFRAGAGPFLFTIDIGQTPVLKEK